MKKILVALLFISGCATAKHVVTGPAPIRELRSWSTVSVNNYGFGDIQRTRYHHVEVVVEHPRASDSGTLTCGFNGEPQSVSRVVFTHLYETVRMDFLASPVGDTEILCTFRGD